MPLSGSLRGIVIVLAILDGEYGWSFGSAWTVTRILQGLVPESGMGSIRTVFWGDLPRFGVCFLGEIDRERVGVASILERSSAERPNGSGDEELSCANTMEAMLLRKELIRVALEEEGKELWQ
jgi:hypothetical protein